MTTDKREVGIVNAKQIYYMLWSSDTNKHHKNALYLKVPLKQVDSESFLAPLKVQ